jgi:outer membrane protein OmpA-like peptidoglycan-associated protein
VPAAKSAPSTAAAIKACTAVLAKASRSGRIRFPSSDTEIRPWSRPALDKVIAALKRCPTLRIEVAGYTDVTGTRALNEKLSKERAAAVVATLVTAGIQADRLKSTGYASQRPIANNRTQAGRARNRRVELTVID